MSGTLTLLAAGLQTYLVDGGRPHTRSLGVPLGGAADRASLAIGNALVGNPPDTPALECCLSGPSLVADVPLACVLFGAPFSLSSKRRPLEGSTSFTLEPGEELHIGGAARGMRAYLCVAGGIAGASILGSRSSLEPLPAGTRLAVCSGRITARRPELECDLETTLRVLPGGQADWFPGVLLRQAEVTTASNRMGLRLRGVPLPVSGREMVSEPVCPGTVQVTRDGQCIILGVDGQTIGGYPKIAHVVAADLDRLGQLRPGTVVTFAYVTPAEAIHLAQVKSQQLRAWQTRLAVTLERTPQAGTAL
ncbi:MAG: biotin-dependent carboxyltransferase family protein [Gemmataceae bacterium]